MFNFDKKIFAQNKKSLIIILSIFAILFILSTIIGYEAQPKLEEKDLEEIGTPQISKLVINEIMSSNGGAFSDESGNNYDWIELYNGNNHSVNLKNYGLSDRENQIKWVFPETIIEANSYLIIYLSGTKQDGLYADFKLSSAGGEVLALKNANGKVVDAIETIALNKNSVMARDLNGNWFITSKSTPGYANTEDGYETFKNNLIALEDDIKINEILPRNKGNFNIDGHFYGYIEIINTGKNVINLKDYSVSNSWQSPFKYKLPDIDLKPNEVLVLYTDTNNDADGNIYTGFKLDAKSGSVVISYNNKVVDYIDYEEIPNGMALVKQNDKIFTTNNISPGYLNTVDGGNSFSKKFLSNSKKLIINEVMNSNYSYLPQNGGKYYDWVELKNNSKENISLSDYYLTTNDDLKEKYNLPDVILKPNEKYVIMASGDTNLSNSTYKHANFKIGDIESLYLVKDNKIEDSIFIANVKTGYSIGRNNNSGFYYFSNPTPLKDNDSGTREVAYKPEFSIEPGIYNNVDKIELQIKAGGTIYYSLDGSIPNTSSKKYNGPLFLDKTTVVKAISYESGKITSEPVVASYIINENHTMPVLSISMKSSDFNYVHGHAWETGLEVAAYAELYEDGKSFSIPCGFKLFGGSTRGLAKKSFSLKFKKKYGASELHYQVFDNRDFSTFNTLVIRSGSQDNMHAMMRDVLGTSLVDGLINVDVQAYKPVILYINGNYWGIYNIREKVDDEFVSNHYNVEEGKANVVSILNSVSDGSIADYSSLVRYMSSHDLSKSENYEYVKTKLNIDSFVDFWAAETWITNNDILNTRFIWHPDVDNGRIRMVFYDLDWAMYNYYHDYFKFTIQPEGMSDFKVSTLMMRSLIKNEEFKKTYLERISYQLKNVWNKERVLNRIDELYQELLPEMPRNQKRWNLTMENWNNYVDDLKEYANLRQDYMIKQAKSFFKLNDEEFRKYFGDLV